MYSSEIITQVINDNEMNFACDTFGQEKGYYANVIGKETTWKSQAQMGGYNEKEI